MLFDSTALFNNASTSSIRSLVSGDDDDDDVDETLLVAAGFLLSFVRFRIDLNNSKASSNEADKKKESYIDSQSKDYCNITCIFYWRNLCYC